MTFLGLTIEDWASLFAVLGSIVTVIFYLFRVIVVNPINYRNLTLQASIGSLTQELKKMREEVDQVHQDMNRHLSNHDVALARHEVEISDLKAGK